MYWYILFTKILADFYHWSKIPLLHVYKLYHTLLKEINFVLAIQYARLLYICTTLTVIWINIVELSYYQSLFKCIYEIVQNFAELKCMRDESIIIKYSFRLYVFMSNMIS